MEDLYGFTCDECGSRYTLDLRKFGPYSNFVCPRDGTVHLVEPIADETDGLAQDYELDG